MIADHEAWTARPKLGAHGSFQRCCLDSGEAFSSFMPEASQRKGHLIELSTPMGTWTGRLA